MHVIDVLHEVFAGMRHEHALPSCIKAIDDRAGVLIVRLQGDVGKAIGGEFQSDEERVKSMPHAWERSVIFDFADTREIDFATVSYLIQSLRNRATSHARVGIINALPKLRAEIQIAKLDNLLPTFASEGEALKALGSGA